MKVSEGTRIRGEMGEEVSTETYVCECGDATCVERIRLTRPEYEAVRAYSTRFAIAIDHENPEIDQLVAEGGGYSVVQKIAGRPARIARQTDHRRAPGEDLGSASGAAR